MAGLKEEWLKFMNMYQLIGDEFPEYIAYQQQKIYNVLEDVYSIGSATELQEAIDEIGSGAGTIFIEAGTHIISSTIDVDTGGTIVIYGHGDNTILLPNDNVDIFNVTDGIVIIEKIKLDLINYTANSKGIIINETNNKVSVVDSITITGDGVNGIGIELSSNNCRINNCNISNIDYGINILSDDNILNGNDCDNCVTYGINIDGDYNKLIANIIDTNGVGTNLTVNADSNHIRENKLSGNTVQWSDNGTNNDIEYRCYNGQDIQDAIDSIAVKSGTVHILPIAGGIQLTATIDVDGGGDYIIEGEGVGTVIDCAGDRTAFNITSARSCVLRNFKIDANDLTTNIKPIIEITEAVDNKIICENLTIDGDGINGYGIELHSDNCIVRDCDIGSIKTAIWCTNTADKITIDGNHLSPIVDFGIILQGDYCTISNNICDNAYIFIDTGSSFNTITMNTSSNSDGHGIVIQGNDNTLVGNVCDNNDYHGINVSNAHRIIVNGNVCNNNGWCGICYLGANDGNITGNMCNANGASFASYGGILISGSDRTTITGNTCNNNDRDNAIDGYGIMINANSDNNTITGNVCCNNNNIGAGDGYGLIINSVDCDGNIISSNKLTGNDVDYLDNGTGTEKLADNTAYGVGWNGDKGTATKDAIYDKIESLVDFNPPIGYITMFSGAWTDNTTIVGWYKCDGNNGTVDLVDKFIRGGVASGAEGGSDDAIVVEHSHDIKISTGAGGVAPLITIDETTTQDGTTTTEDTGIAGVGKNIPAYYTLIFIQRIS